MSPSASPTPYRVILSTPRWTLNGVNVFSLNLLRGLRARGVDARVLLTEEDTELVAADDPPMARPAEIRFDDLPVRWWEGWGAHWGATIRYLEALSPCVYIPNYDYRHSCVSPLLSERVSMVGVVHSDDPLHYDHVNRLGEYWDATVCVSRTLSERTASLCPSISERIETIPIGIAVPPTQPPRARHSGESLRIVYHGVLKQHQKRILDLPRVVAALEERGVPVRLTIAGGGPDEEMLRMAAAPQVERGSIRFLGVVPHEQIPELLRSNDAYLLTSEFEGMPNALLEAMANGCVPVVSDMESGIPEVVRDGDSGLLIPVGDIESFAEGLAELQTDPDRRMEMAAQAYRSVSRGAFSSEEMISAYLELFDRVVRDARQGTFRRPSGLLVPPPAEVGGVGIFQSADEELGHKAEGVGWFPSRQDHRDFERCLAPRTAVRVAGLKVIASSPFWTDNWSNVKCHELLRGLSRLGVSVRLLLTEERTNRASVSEPRLPYPAEIPVDWLPVGRRENWGGHWGAMIRYLERRAPCVYLPMHDWRHSCVAPRLSEKVTIVGRVPDDEVHFEHAARMGRYWNAVVATDASTARVVEQRVPELAERMSVIRLGLDVPEVQTRKRPSADSPLRIVVYRSEDRDESQPTHLQRILERLEASSVPVDVTVIGSHPEHPGTLAVFEVDSALGSGDRLDSVNHDALMVLFETSDVVVVLPESNTLTEDLQRAMARGCVLVIASHGETLSYLLGDGHNGFFVGATDVTSISDRLTLLQRDPERLAAMSTAARETARKMFTIDDMAEAYAELLQRLVDEAAEGAFRRPVGELRPPAAEVGGSSIFPVELSYAVEGVGRFPSRWDYRRFKGQLGRFQRWRDLAARRF